VCACSHRDDMVREMLGQSSEACEKLAKIKMGPLAFSPDGFIEGIADYG